MASPKNDGYLDKLKVLSTFIKDVGFPIFSAVAIGILIFVWSGWVRADRKEERTQFTAALKELKGSLDKNTESLNSLVKRLDSMK